MLCWLKALSDAATLSLPDLLDFVSKEEQNVESITAKSSCFCGFERVYHKVQVSSSKDCLSQVAWIMSSDVDSCLICLKDLATTSTGSCAHCVACGNVICVHCLSYEVLPLLQELGPLPICMQCNWGQEEIGLNIDTSPGLPVYVRDLTSYGQFTLSQITSLFMLNTECKNGYEVVVNVCSCVDVPLSSSKTIFMIAGPKKVNDKNKQVTYTVVVNSQYTANESNRDKQMDFCHQILRFIARISLETPFVQFEIDDEDNDDEDNNMNSSSIQTTKPPIYFPIPSSRAFEKLQQIPLTQWQYDKYYSHVTINNNSSGNDKVLLIDKCNSGETDRSSHDDQQKDNKMPQVKVNTSNQERSASLTSVESNNELSGSKRGEEEHKSYPSDESGGDEQIQVPSSTLIAVAKNPSDNSLPKRPSPAPMTRQVTFNLTKSADILSSSSSTQANTDTATSRPSLFVKITPVDGDNKENLQQQEEIKRKNYEKLTGLCSSSSGSSPNTPTAADNNSDSGSAKGDSNKRRGSSNRRSSLAFLGKLGVSTATTSDAPDESEPVAADCGLNKEQLQVKIDATVSTKEATALMEASSKNPKELLGWQILVTEEKTTPTPKNIYVITGVRKNLLMQSEFRITNNYVAANNSSDYWVKLKRKDKKDGMNFRPLRKVLDDASLLNL